MTAQVTTDEALLLRWPSACRGLALMLLLVMVLQDQRSREALQAAPH